MLLQALERSVTSGQHDINKLTHARQTIILVRVVDHGTEGVHAHTEGVPIVHHDVQAVGLNPAQERADIVSTNVIQR